MPCPGAGLWSSLTSAINGAAAGFTGGAIIGGMHGGDGGGILGIGSIGQLVGMIGAGIIGSVTAGTTAAIIGWNDPASINALVTQFWTSTASGNFHDTAANKLI